MVEKRENPSEWQIQIRGDSGKGETVRERRRKRDRQTER